MTKPVPLRRDAVVAALRAMEPELRARGVAALYLFGSVARDEAGAGSDVDVFCDFRPDAPIGWSYFGFRPMISERLGREVDFIERGGLHRLIREEVQAQALRVF